MKQPRFYSLEGLQYNGKFLTKHRSSIFSSLCSSCLNPKMEDIDEISPFGLKITQNKISIKEIANRSAKTIPWGGHKKKGSRNYSHEYKKSETSCLQRDSFTKTSNDLGQSFTDRQFNGSFHIPSKIFFTYNNKPDNINNTMDNCKAINAVSQKNSSNPEEIKGGRSVKEQNREVVKSKLEQEFNDVLDLKEEFQINEDQQNKYATVGEEFQFATIDKQPKEQMASDADVNMGHFSFGHQQKTYFMNKLKNQVISKQPQTIKELKQSLFQLSSQNNQNKSIQSKRIKQNAPNNEQYIQFNRGTFNKEGIFNYIRRAQTLNQDLILSDSEQSVVIDNFQSYVDRLLVRKRKKTQNSHNSDF